MVHWDFLRLTLPPLPVYASHATPVAYVLPAHLHCMPILLPLVTSSPLTPQSLPLQYLGDKTPPAVKQKLRELLIGWKEGLPLEPKIGECFEMLEKCGLITDPSASDTVCVCRDALIVQSTFN